MKRRIVAALLLAHVALLLLAATRFSIVSWLWGEVSWQLNYFQYAYRKVWGILYVSEYTLSQVVVYVSAYFVGLLTFQGVGRTLPAFIRGAGVVICLLGLVSFSLESTHWFWRHGISWIASFPVLLLPLWIWLAARLAR
jgi:hypothetical protein